MPECCQLKLLRIYKTILNKVATNGTAKEATRLLADFMNDSIVFGLSDEIVEHTIDIRKAHKVKTPFEF